MLDELRVVEEVGKVVEIASAHCLL
jgi:hypothetical protein